MYETSALLFLYNETSLHPGSGTGIGDVDQPIQREVYTQLPVIHDSGVKGASRHDMAEAKGIYELEARIKELESEDERTKKQQEELDDKLKEIKPFEAVFGPNVGTGREHEHGGALGLSDARILLFPVRSLRGLFAWVTCPFVLGRLRRDLSKVIPKPPQNTNGAPAPEGATPEAPSLPEALSALDALLEMPMPEEGTAWASASCFSQIEHGESPRIVLEDFTFSREEDARSPHVETVGRWLGEHTLPPDGAFDHMRGRLPHSLVVLPDDMFRDFTRFSTEIVTRIRIDETGTVAEGALWNEEHLPSDCLLYSLTPATRSLAPDEDDMGAGEVLEMLADHLDEPSLIQFGGGKSLSRGLTQVTLQDAEALLAETPGDGTPSSAEDAQTSSPNA